MACGAGVNVIDAALPWLPASAVVPIALSGMKKKRWAIPLIIFVYFLVMLIVSILPLFLEMTNTGKTDPQLVAGAMAEDIVSGILLSLFCLPLLFIIWFAFRKANLKQQ